MNIIKAIRSYFDSGYSVDRTYGTLREQGYQVEFQEIVILYTTFIEERETKRMSKIEKVWVKFDVNTRAQGGNSLYCYNAPKGLKPDDIVIVDTVYGPSLARVTTVGRTPAGYLDITPHRFVLDKVDLVTARMELSKFVKDTNREEEKEKIKLQVKSLNNHISALCIKRDSRRAEVTDIQSEINQLVRVLNKL